MEQTDVANTGKVANAGKEAKAAPKRRRKRERPAVKSDPRHKPSSTTVTATSMVYARGKICGKTASVMGHSIWIGGLIVEYIDVSRAGRYHVLDLIDPVVSISALSTSTKQCLASQESGFVSLIRVPSNGNTIKPIDTFFFSGGANIVTCDPVRESNTFVAGHDVLLEYDLVNKCIVNYVKEKVQALTFVKPSTLCIIGTEKMKIWDVKAGKITASQVMEKKAEWKSVTSLKGNTIYLGGDEGIWTFDIRKPEAITQWSSVPSQSLCVLDDQIISCSPDGNVYSFESSTSYTRIPVPNCILASRVDDVVVVVG